MVRFIDQRIGIQTRVDHDPVYEVVYNGCNTVYTP